MNLRTIMTVRLAACLCIVVILSSCGHAFGNKTLSIDIVMPATLSGVNAEDYICTGLRPKFPRRMFIKQYETFGLHQNTHHHMVLFLCPGVPPELDFWKCGPVPCPVIFGWGKDSSHVSFSMPDGVGVEFPVGSTLVLQIHFKTPFIVSNGITERPGIRLVMSKRIPPFAAGVLVMGAWKNLKIPPRRDIVPIDVNCRMRPLETPITVFAYRTHAHSLGTAMAAYKLLVAEPASTNGNQLQTRYEQIAKGDPRWPQRFYQLERPFVLHPDDIVAGRCVYDSRTRDQWTLGGPKSTEEMCQMNLMYFTDMRNGPRSLACAEAPLPLPPLPVSSLLPPTRWKHASRRRNSVHKRRHQIRTQPAETILEPNSNQWVPQQEALQQQQNVAKEVNWNQPPALQQGPGQQQNDGQHLTTTNPPVHYQQQQQWVNNPPATIQQQPQFNQQLPPQQQQTANRASNIQQQGQFIQQTPAHQQQFPNHASNVQQPQFNQQQELPNNAPSVQQAQFYQQPQHQSFLGQQQVQPTWQQMLIAALQQQGTTPHQQQTALPSYDQDEELDCCIKPALSYCCKEPQFEELPTKKGKKKPSTNRNRFQKPDDEVTGKS